MKIKKCILCKKEIEGFGNNALPIESGRCCDSCNNTKVIPVRLKQITKEEVLDRLKLNKK